MKNILCLTVCALSLLAFASTAQSQGAEATGDFDFDLPDATGTIVFEGGINNAGTVSGQMSFSAIVHVPDPDNPGNTVPLDVTLGVAFDCMSAKGNRAAMSGIITSASANVAGYIGQEAMLIVEDQVLGISPATDAFAWGVYQPTEVNLNAKDFDFCPRNYAPPDDCGVERELPPCPIPPPGCVNNVPDDPGATLTYTASDYELCPYPPPSDEQNFVPQDPHNYVCFTGTPDPNAVTTGIPTIRAVVVDGKSFSLACDRFPVPGYQLNLIPQGGGNKVNVKTGT